MTVLVVPALDPKPWPSLGGQVCDFIEEHLTFGPGDLRGKPARIDDEKRGLIYRMYEVYPRRHEEAGRRRFNRCTLSLRKGSAKTELAAWIAICELHPDAPVRCVGWDRKGQPIAGGVTDPYIPMVAYTEEQSEELAYGAMRAILLEDECDLGQDFDVGLERIMRVNGDGKAEALATAPNSRDGARTTFQHFDETHHMTLARLKKAHRAMLANIPKRNIADAWSLETTTAPAPGENSVAEDTMVYAQAIHDGKITEPRLFFFHRQASDHHDLSTVKGLRAAVKEASGPVAKWSNIGGIVDQFKDPTADRTYLQRVWLNRIVRSADRAFDSEKWKKLALAGQKIPAGAVVALGFDGSRYEDSTAIVATDILTGLQELVGLWEKPYGATAWEVPVLEVDQAIERAFTHWNVWKLYADPPYWERLVADWSGKYGEERVIAWSTRQWQKMADACLAFANAIIAGELSHDGHDGFARHVANAFKRILRTVRDKEGRAVWIIQKERPDSPNKIDAAVTGVLSWQARLDALEAGIGVPVPPQDYTVEWAG